MFGLASLHLPAVALGKLNYIDAQSGMAQSLKLEEITGTLAFGCALGGNIRIETKLQIEKRA